MEKIGYHHRSCDRSQRFGEGGSSGFLPEPVGSDPPVGGGANRNRSILLKICSRFTLRFIVPSLIPINRGEKVSTDSDRNSLVRGYAGQRKKLQPRMWPQGGLRRTSP